MTTAGCRILVASAFAAGLATAAETSSIKPKIDCASMAGRTIDAKSIGLPTRGATLTTAVLNAASVPPNRPGSPIPEYCYISGSIAPIDSSAPNILFAVAIPTAWNRKAWQVGGSSLDGSIPGGLAAGRGNFPANGAYSPDAVLPISKGYAMYGSDSGHQAGVGAGRGGRGGSGAQGNAGVAAASGGRGFGRGPVDPAAVAAANAWVLNEESWKNYAYEQLKKTHDTVMQVFQLMYGERPKVNYFGGESEGGREALEAISRWPRDYDGAVAYVPVVYSSGIAISAVMHGISQLPPGAWIPPAKALAVRNETVRLCDSLDGLADGVINNYVACNKLLDPAITKDPLAHIRCAGGADTGNDCLSDAQMAVANSFHASLKFPYPLSNGETDFPGWGTGLEGFMQWMLSGTQPDVKDFNSYAGNWPAAATRGRLGGSQAANLLTLDLAQSKDKVQEFSKDFDAPADWSGFLKRNGKVLIVGAASDYLANPRAQMRFYEKLVSRHGQKTIDAAARYYVEPNLWHGSTGTSAGGKAIPHYKDMPQMLIDWVENNKAPAELVVETDMDTAPPYTVHSSRPLCRYPQYPRYNGAGDPTQATSYACTAP